MKITLLIAVCTLVVLQQMHTPMALGIEVKYIYTCV
jgi:hypothetical protein